jgi:hypothetical protein
MHVSLLRLVSRSVRREHWWGYPEVNNEYRGLP